MTKRIRAVVAAGALFAALATAGSAWASYAPKLLVKSASGATNGLVTVTATVGATDDATARAQIYVPAGYTIATSTPAGTKLGAVTAQASAADLNNTILTLTGELDAIAPNAAAQAQCGVASAAATWDMHLDAAGQTLDIPVYVVQNTGAEATVSPTKLVVCLPPPDVPVGTPGRSAFGAKLISASFTSSAIVSPTTLGSYRWTSLWTPYTPAKGTPNAAGSVETQALVRLPANVQISGLKRIRHAKTRTVRVKGKKVKRTTVTTGIAFGAKVTEGGDAVSGAKVTAKANGRSLGTATTTSTGIAAGAFVFAKGTVTLAVTAVIPDRDLGASACVKSAAFGGLPCVDATAGGSTHTASIKVTAYKR
jgi:hypothetical protein